jgi:purine catabolism regulator
MSMTVREILDLAAVQAAAPVLTTSAKGLNRQVMWAHSSEIFEIGPLLSGGELLLTTGLGLAGAGAGARRFWIRDLAERGVTAVAIEIGRSLAALPAELVDEADRREIPLIRLDDVVPFERICRAVNTVILDREGTELRVVDQLSDALFSALATGGLESVARIAARHTGGPVMISTASGQVAAAGGVASKHVLSRLPADASVRAPVLVDGGLWGDVFLGKSSAWAPGALSVAARRIAAAACVAVAHMRDAPGEPGAAAPALLEDLLKGNVASEHEFIVRAGLTGLHPPGGAMLLGMAASTTDPKAATALIRTAGAHTGGGIAGRVRDQVFGIVVADAEAADPAGALAHRLRQQGVAPGHDLTCVIGPPVPAVEAGRSLREAHAGVDHGGAGIRVWRESVPDRLLSLLDETTRRQLVDDLLGPLQRWDAAHGSDLVRTVDIYLRYGCSPTRAADHLHVRRQSLHQRLRRAEELLGHPVDDPVLMMPMLLSIRAADRLTPIVSPDLQLAVNRKNGR